ncbi:hypothetical protein [Nocardia sp. XZ_19_231]|uniref:hypothetical protein n=1 Tax=Nocardia sp. XZ_19_231 TaxID=2769252 RepID=UPI00188ED506|nr:hypothetical protein [Nocardia sp. XZ_19_231]
MSDTSFMSIKASTYDNTLEVEYQGCIGMVTVDVGPGATLYLTPADAAVVAEKLLAALDVYASTLRAVA